MIYKALNWLEVAYCPSLTLHPHLWVPTMLPSFYCSDASNCSQDQHIFSLPKMSSLFPLFKANSSSIAQLNRKPLLLYAFMASWMLYDMVFIILTVGISLYYQINAFMRWDTLQKWGLCLFSWQLLYCA